MSTMTSDNERLSWTRDVTLQRTEILTISSESFVWA